MLQLWPFQDQMIQEVGDAWRQGYRDICLQSPTGSGKTFMGGELIRRIHAQGRRTLVLVHTEELMKQFLETLYLAGVGLDFGTIKSGHPTIQERPHDIASVQTLARPARLAKLTKSYDMILTDEAHHAAADSYQRIYRHFPHAHRLGLSATPARLDNKPLLGTFDYLVLGPEPAWLIEHGYLSTYRRLKVQGTFDPDDHQIADISRIIQAYAHGLKTIVFASNRGEARHITDKCLQDGLKAAYIDGDTKPGLRADILATLEFGDLQIVVNVDLISEGFDCPNVKCIILNRPTNSIVVHLQQIGRALRKIPGDDTPAVILDVAGNTDDDRLGLPDDRFVWSLQDGVRHIRNRKDDVPRQRPREREEHNGPFEDVPLTMIEVGGSQRTIRPADTKGAKHNLNDVRKALKVCKTLDQCKELAHALGYAEGWAIRQWDFKVNYGTRKRRTYYGSKQARSL